ncbi:MAG: F0F1 ATP synthase subunit delta [Nostocaceae cyanobacterium]|nr:F0F1 ATP synthase subunit delta [Nostocaceae cyanobacterium]
MLIDWFTVFAQFVNFIIIVFLLQRFLYKPITQAMDERQKRMYARWEEAEQARQSAEKQAEIYQQKQQELEKQRNTLITKMEEKVNEYRQELIHQARQEVEEMQAKWRTAIEQEQDGFLENLQIHMQNQIFMITQRILQDLANSDLEQQVINQFINRMRSLDEEEINNWSKLLDDKFAQDIVINSNFDLSSDSRHKIINILREKQIIKKHNVQFATDNDLICGIELKIGGNQITWSVDNYLQKIQDNFKRLFPDKA